MSLATSWHCCRCSRRRCRRRRRSRAKYSTKPHEGRRTVCAPSRRAVRPAMEHAETRVLHQRAMRSALSSSSKQVTSMPSQSSSATPPNRSWQARSGHMWGDHDGACVTNPDVRVKNFVRVPVLGCLAQKGLERCACVRVGRRAHVRGWMWVCG